MFTGGSRGQDDRSTPWSQLDLPNGKPYVTDDLFRYSNRGPGAEIRFDVLRSLVAEVRPADLPMPDLGRLIGADVYALHARFLADRPQQYDARTRETLLRGRGISPAESGRLRQALERHRATIPEVFSRVDLVIVPTLPVLPMRIADATEPFALPGCTFAFSLGGWPSISVPCGYSRSGLPIGLLISGPPFAEPHILALAQAYERVTAWHSRQPQID